MDDNVEFEILKEILIVIHDFHEHAEHAFKRRGFTQRI
jgi:hypothetical protein